MNIRTKLISSYLLIAAIVGAVGYFGSKTIRDISASFNRVYQQKVPTLESLETLRFAGLRIVASVSEFGFIKAERKMVLPEQGGELDQENEEQRLIQDGLAAYEQAFQRYAALVRAYSPDDIQYRDTIRAASSKLTKTGLVLIGLKESGVSGNAILTAKEGFEADEKVFLAAVDAALRDKEEELKEARNRAAATATSTLRAMIFLGVFACLAAIVIGAVLSHRISVPLLELRDAALKLERGELASEVNMGTRDELGLLAGAFNRMSLAVVEATLTKEKERAYLDNILQNMADILLVIELQGKIQTINRVAVDILGYTQEELVGKSSFILFENVSSEEEEEEEEEEVLRIFKGSHLEGLARRGFVRDIELNLLAKDGKTIPVLMSGSMLRNSNGKSEGIVIVGKDLTERKRIEAILLQSEKLSAVGQLAAGVAHEINNPLGIILGFAQSAMKRLPASDVLALPIRSIEREALRCKNLVQNLLAFSRQSKSRVEQFDLNETVESTLGIIEAQARVKSVEVFKELGDVEPLLGDKNQLQQVIVNLCNNAIDAMPNGGKIIVRTRGNAVNGKRRITLEVEDSGSGIPEEIRDKVFNPFFTTKEVGKGTGLGLSLVHEIIQKHNGRIELKSVIGQGTVFTITFPVKPGGQDGSDG